MTDTSQPAFPANHDPQTFNPETVGELRRLLSGMSMRQYYAASSPVSLVDANESLNQHSVRNPLLRKFGKKYPIDLAIAEQVRLSFLYADMMIAQSGE